MIMRPSIARPAQGFDMNGFQHRFTPSAAHMSPPAKAKPLRRQGKFDTNSNNGNNGSFLPSPQDDMVAYDLERLADESNIAEILEHGFSNGASCLRVSLSPRGVLRESVVDDFNNLSLESYAQNPSLMTRIKRKNHKGPMVITSDD